MTPPSLNEIARKVEAAAKGKGWSIGQAADLGFAAAWLSAQGIDGIPASLAAINEPQAEPTNTIAQSITAIDAALASGDGSAKILLISQPLVLLGLCGWAATQSAKAFSLTGLIRAEIEAASLSFGPDFTPDQTGIYLCARSDDTARKTSRQRTPPDSQAWDEISGLASRILVPATEASRAFGAGEGGRESETF